MAEKQYIVSIKFTEDFMADYNKIKTFETNYTKDLIKVQAMPEKTETNKSDKEAAHTELQEKFEEVARISFTKDRYDLRNFYEEVMLEFNTYAQHDTKNNTFIFNDTLTPMFVFAYIAKMYPKVLEYLIEYKLTYNNNVLVDFMTLLA